MADVQILKTTFDVSKSRIPVRATTDGTEGLPWATREGALVTQDWKQALVAEGRVFMANHGTGTTPVAGKAYDIDQPQAVIRNPSGSGYAMIPLVVDIHMEDTVSTAADLVVAFATIDIGAGTSTSTVRPINLLGGTLNSAFTFSYTYSGDGTAAVQNTNYWELAHTGCMYDVAEDSMAEPHLLWDGPIHPILYPPCTLFAFYGSAGSSTGFVTFVWAEVPLASVSG
jgi:hypothetical protein